MIEPWQTIYVGNLPTTAGKEDLQRLFADFGDVRQVTLLPDPESGTHRGFGFVEMTYEAAQAAIVALDGLTWQGNLLRVNEARDRGAPAPRRAY